MRTMIQQTLLVPLHCAMHSGRYNQDTRLAQCNAHCARCSEKSDLLLAGDGADARVAST
jgi:hypothetical protein